MSDFLQKTFQFEGKSYEIDILSGQVIDSQARSNTHVTGQGSGGDSQISSYIEVVTDVWLKGKSGKEFCVACGNINVRAGHDVQVVYIKDKPVIVNNRTMDECYEFKGAAYETMHKGYWFFSYFPYGLVFAITAYFIAMSTGTPYTPVYPIWGVLWSIFSLFPAWMLWAFIHGHRLEKRKVRFQSAIFDAFQKAKDELGAVTVAAEQPKPQSATMAEEKRDKFCTNCGKSVVAEAKFCGRCGSPAAA